MSQISHIKYKDIIEAGRFDADYFKPEILKAEKILTSNKYSFLGDFYITDGEHGSPERDTTTNIKYVTAEKIKEGYIEDGEFETISMQQYERNLRASLRPNDLLIYSVGMNCGLSAVFENHLSPASIPRSVAIIRTDNSSLARFLCVFLISKYGKSQTQRLKAGNAQPMLALEQIKKIKYPIINEKFYDNISKIYNLAYENRIKSKQLYQEAEDLLLTELGLKNHTISHTLTFSTTKKAVDEAGRYDADYFQPKYDELIEKIENYKGGFFSFSDKQYVKIIRGSLISDKYYDEKEGTPYIRGADFSDGTLGFDKLVYINKSFVRQNETIVHLGDIVFSLIGSVGATALVTEEFNNSYISNNVGCLELNNINPETVQVMLQTIIGQMQFDRLKTQTAQPKISSEQMMEIKLPLMSPQLQKEISDKIKESFKLRNESKELLEQAKKMVEDEIEKE